MPVGFADLLWLVKGGGYKFPPEYKKSVSYYFFQIWNPIGGTVPSPYPQAGDYFSTTESTESTEISYR